jgi:hypothetical protein
MHTTLSDYQVSVSPSTEIFTQNWMTLDLKVAEDKMVCRRNYDRRVSQMRERSHWMMKKEKIIIL